MALIAQQMVEAVVATVEPQRSETPLPRLGTEQGAAVVIFVLTVAVVVLGLLRQRTESTAEQAEAPLSAGERGCKLPVVGLPLSTDNFTG